ncbi:MAG: BlaI/MecI/CopY family transcriptional regulator [Marmoricola sp.]
MRQLGQLEAVVMARVWSADDPVLVREVLEDIQRGRDIAYTTVMTVMDNLHRKGVLSRERDGRAYRSRAVRSREEHTADLMEEVFATTGDKTVTLMHFVQQRPTVQQLQIRATSRSTPRAWLETRPRLSHPRRTAASRPRRATPP